MKKTWKEILPNGLRSLCAGEDYQWVVWENTILMMNIGNNKKNQTKLFVKMSKGFTRHD